MTRTATLAALWPQDREALAAFDHAAHIRMAREYILALPLPLAFASFARDLEAMTHRFGASAKFHRTITLAWLLVVTDRVLRSDPDATWQEFTASNSDLLANGDVAIRDLYLAETLASPSARETYLLPDRSLACASGS
jgi:hypothetical protein